jgi:hypothetical protein
MNAEGLAIVQIGGNARGGHRPVDHSPRSILGTDARGYHPPVTALCGQRRSTDVQARQHRDRPPRPA